MWPETEDACYLYKYVVFLSWDFSLAWPHTLCLDGFFRFSTKVKVCFDDTQIGLLNEESVTSKCVKKEQSLHWKFDDFISSELVPDCWNQPYLV